MASIRRLKKDIDYLTFAIVDDCICCLAMGKSTEDISGVVQQVIDSRNALRRRVNEGRKVEQAGRKAYYQSIFKELLNSVDGTCNQLSELVKKA